MVFFRSPERLRKFSLFNASVELPSLVFMTEFHALLIFFTRRRIFNEIFSSLGFEKNELNEGCVIVFINGGFYSSFFVNNEDVFDD